MNKVIIFLKLEKNLKFLEKMKFSPYFSLKPKKQTRYLDFSSNFAVEASMNCQFCQSSQMLSVYRNHDFGNRPKYDHIQIRFVKKPLLGIASNFQQISLTYVSETLYIWTWWEMKIKTKTPFFWEKIEKLKMTKFSFH